MPEIDRDLILRYAARNRVKFGKASPKPVLGKVMAEHPEYRSIVKEVIMEVEKAVEQVNSMPMEEVLKLAPPEEEEGRKESSIPKLPPLEGAREGGVVTRFAPNPDFVLHLGSLRPLILSYEYAKMYRGKFYVRFEDTDPKTKPPREEFYRGIMEDIEWLGIRPDAYVYQSDRLEIYYAVAKALLSNGEAYVCLCGRDEFKRYVSESRPCPHRDTPPEDNLELFEKMLTGAFGEGEAVLRIKTDLEHPNQSVRDWAAMRIIDTSKYPHPRKGSRYLVWPLYNFSCAIDDHYMGITHVLRGAEHRVNEEKQRYVFEAMGWEPPIYVHHGRVAIPEGILSKSKILRGIEEGVYTGIDDPRLATIAAFRRRGFRPEALYNTILKTGLSSSITTIDMSMLYSENRRLIDPVSNRYYGVREPIMVEAEITVDEAIVSLRKHPDHPERGSRKYVFRRGVHRLYLDREDRDRLGGGMVRLIGLGNFRVLNGFRLVMVSTSVEEARRLGIPFIHWVPEGGAIQARFIYPEGMVEGYAERYLLDEDVGSTIQLERLGYFKIESMEEGGVTVIFTHP